MNVLLVMVDNLLFSRTYYSVMNESFEINPIRLNLRTIEIADKREQRKIGLMDRQSLHENDGMLFIFDEEKIGMFWMRNTPLSLDIFFIDADGRITNIFQNTTPNSEQSIYSSDPNLVLYALETNAGYAAQNQLHEGMIIDVDDLKRRGVPHGSHMSK